VLIFLPLQFTDHGLDRFNIVPLKGGLIFEFGTKEDCKEISYSYWANPESNSRVVSMSLFSRKARLSSVATGSTEYAFCEADLYAFNGVVWLVSFSFVGGLRGGGGLSVMTVGVKPSRVG
jgi:hypothetical protein